MAFTEQDLNNQQQEIARLADELKRLNSAFEAQKKELGIEGDYRGVGHVVLGYADCDLPNPAPRKEGRIHYVK